MTKHLIYVDEKGPQEHIQGREHPDSKFPVNDPRRRFSLGSDSMTNYVMAAIDIPEEELLELESEFIQIENTYRRADHNYEGEIKGAKLLEGKQFKLGFASMQPRELNMYTQMFNLVSEHDVKICIMVQNKAAAIITRRLHNWIIMASRVTHTSYAVNAYVLAKHFTLEADARIIELAQNQDTTTYWLLKTIKNGLNKYLKTPANKRTEQQRNSYKSLVNVISKTLNLNTGDSPEFAGAFEWRKVDFSLGIWQDERALNGENSDYDLYCTQEIITR